MGSDMKAQLLIPALASLVCGCHGSSTSSTDPGDMATSVAAAAPACAAGSRSGLPGGDDAFASPNGTAIIVRTPTTYDPTIASPLIVVYSAANKHSSDTETATALTMPATARGYIVAYVDHITPQTDADIQEAADSATAVINTWCVDSKRVYMTGHSDGGSMTHLVLLAGLIDAAAVAPSAAGINSDYVAHSTCTTRPVPHLEIHSSGDSLFPISQGFGPDVAKWYATCSSCDPTPSAMDADACQVYSNCSGGAEVKYCQGTAHHGAWPQERDPAVLDFFDRFKLAQ
jgi:polyhydroxybutyrate depolymerase